MSLGDIVPNILIKLTHERYKIKRKGTILFDDTESRSLQENVINPDTKIIIFEGAKVTPENIVNL